MRLFLSEFICGGALSGQSFPESMRREGWAMLSALVRDLVDCGDVRITTTVDKRVSHQIDQSLRDRCEWNVVADAQDESLMFERLAKESDITLVIAPETDGILADRVRRVRQSGNRCLNCSVEAIELCADKLRLASHFERHHLPTIPTELVDFHSEHTMKPRWESTKQLVIKLRDGAGSWLTFVFDSVDVAAWERIAREYHAVSKGDAALIQPFIPGLTLSVAALCQNDGHVELGPIGCQRLSTGLKYLGGSIPAPLSVDQTSAVRELVLSSCRTISGLRGWVGFDIILPGSAISDRAVHGAGSIPQPLLVEINPRMTTSYIGYRQLCQSNIAQQLVRQIEGIAVEPLKWKRGQVDFDAEASS